MLTWMTAVIPSRGLGVTRFIIGAAAVIRSVLAWPILLGLNDREVLRTPYADWLPHPSEALVIGILVLWLASAILFMVGWRVPVSGPLLFAAIVANLTLDQQTYDNHVYLMAWLVLLLTLADAGAGLALKQHDRPVVRWPVLLLMIQTSVVYGFSALTKLNRFFMSGATLSAVLRNGIMPFPEILRDPGFMSTLAPVVVFVELFLAIMLWLPRFRPFAFILGLALHVSITLLMSSTLQLLVFSLEMIALYPLFLGDSTLHVGTRPNSDWVPRIRRFDLLRVVHFGGDTDRLTLRHRGNITSGAAAHTRILEHLVPWLWVAPILRLPGIKHLHDRRHHDTPA